MDLGLRGRVALVTGASKGLGRGIARGLAGEGATVAVASRSRERIVAAAADIGATPFVFDAADLDAAPALVADVDDRLGPIDVLVTNTGGPPGGEPLSFSREQWEAAHRTLVLAPLALIGAVLPDMRRRGWGRVLNVSSSTTREPSPALVLSNVYRSGTNAAFKTLARQVAGEGVTLNSLLPGRIDTDRLRQLYGEGDAAAGIPAGRLGTVEEFAAAAVFLCSGPASYVTGATLTIDGGLTQGL